jgi:hypothetical protein
VFGRIEIEADDIFEFGGELGIVLIIKLSTRCGFNPCARQMRPTLDSEMPASRAILLRDHCVALAGALCVVLATTSATSWR